MENTNVEILYAYLFNLGHQKGFSLVADSYQKGYDLPELKSGSCWIPMEGIQYRHNLGGDQAFHLNKLVKEMPAPFRQGMPVRFEIKDGGIVAIS